jgi:hypothetical protein
MKIGFTMKPAPIASLDVSVKEAWTIHINDGFDTQIGTRLERQASDWRMVFANDKSVTVDTERDAMILIQGIMIGRTLC